MLCGLIFLVQTVFSPNIIPTKHAKQDKIDAEWLGKKSQRVGESIIIVNKSIKETKFDFFSVRSNFMSLMNTKSGIFTCGYATRDSTAFGVHSVK